jgi:hypothetical protein
VKNMQRGFVINGETADDLVGMSISSAGDVNGDGLDDLIISDKAPQRVACTSNGTQINNTAVSLTKHNISNPSGKPGAGKSYIVFGKADSSAIDLSVIAQYKHLKSNHPSHHH